MIPTPIRKNLQKMPETVPHDNTVFRPQYIPIWLPLPVGRMIRGPKTRSYGTGGRYALDVLRAAAPIIMMISVMLVNPVFGAAAIPGLKTAKSEEQDQRNNGYKDWFKEGQATLEKKLARVPQTGPAKNVILFIADGMDPTTVTAARIYDGQSRNLPAGQPGEAHELGFETLPYLAMAKTYTTDMQTPDSAGTASAMVTGVKTRSGIISLSQEARFDSCEDTKAYMVPGLAALAENAGLSTGIVSTARLTHATPATMYAHAANRNWESDRDLPAGAEDCADIARQLIDFNHGDGIDVALGGGRRNFFGKDQPDPEDPSLSGIREDGRDLIRAWTDLSAQHRYIWNIEQFNDTAGADIKLLGLFEPGHMKYDADRAADRAGEPSLAQMTAKAIEILSRNARGYVLMVEAGRVDHAHHQGNAARALIEMQAFDAAVRAALARVDLSETLVIVTADHGHTLTFQGYQQLGTPILGFAHGNGRDPAQPATLDSKPYTTLGYGNGPGSLFKEENEAYRRPDLTEEDVTAIDYRQQAAIPLPYETHGGQDVLIYAGGPQAYLIDGTVEQNYIFHVIDHALSLTGRQP